MSAKKKSPKGKGKPAKQMRKAAGAGKRGGPVEVSSALLDQLVQEAKAVLPRAYAPYSSYRVGAAIATRSGRIYVGCNVENATYGATICAERGAIMQMVAAGELEPVACAVVTEDKEGAAPCGICRQVLAEFVTDMPVALIGLGARGGEHGRVVSLAELLPLAFELEH